MKTKILFFTLLLLIQAVIIVSAQIAVTNAYPQNINVILDQIN